MKKYICLFIMSLSLIVNCSDTLVPPANYNDTEYTLKILNLETLSLITSYEINWNHGTMAFRDQNKKLYLNASYSIYEHYSEKLLDLETGALTKYDSTVVSYPEDSIRIYRDYSHYYVFNRNTGKTSKILRSHYRNNVLDYSKCTATLYYSINDSLFSIKIDSTENRFLAKIPGNNMIVYGKLISENDQDISLLCTVVDEYKFIVYKNDLSTGSFARMFSTLIPSYHLQKNINLSSSENNNNLLFKGYCGNNFELFSIPLNGGKKTRITHTDQHETHAQYLPDGRILFLAGENEDFNFYWVNDSQLDLYIMNAVGSNSQKIAENVSTNYAISEDGTRLAYIEQKLQDIDND